MNIFLKTQFLLLTLCSALLLSESAVNPLEEFENYDATRVLLREAEDHIAQEKYAKAAKCYQKAANLQTSEEKKAEYFYLEAQNLMLGKKDTKAFRAYRKLLKEYIYFLPLEDIMEQLRELAGNFEQGNGTVFGLKDPDAAIDIYQLIIEHEPDGRQSLTDRLTLAAKQEKEFYYERAVKTYQEIIKLLPNDPDARFCLARLLEKMAQERDADGVLSRAAIREARRFLEVSSAKDFRRPEAEEILKSAHLREGARMLERAQFYLVKYHYKPEIARTYLLDLRRDFSDTPAGEQAKAILDEKFPEEAK